MQKALILTIGAIGMIALLLNAFALLIFIKKPKQKRGCKFMIAIVLLLNMLYSISFSLSIPKVVVHNFCVVLLSSGPLSSHNIGLILLSIDFLAVHSSLLVIMNSLFYKYITLCRSKYSFIYSSPKWLFMLAALNVLIVIMCTSTTTLGMWSAKDIGRDIEETVLSVTSVNIRTAAFVGFCIKRGQHRVVCAFHTVVVVIRTSLLISGFYCVQQVKKKLESSFLNGTMKIIKRRVSNMLLGQIFCLAGLLQPPFMVQPFLLHTGGTSGSAMILCFMVLFSLIPVFSPIIFIVLLCGKNSFLSKMFKQYNTVPITRF